MSGIKNFDQWFMSRTAVKEGFGIGNKNYRPFFKVKICKAKEVMIKRKDPVPIRKGKKLCGNKLLHAQPTPMLPKFLNKIRLIYFPFILFCS